MFARNFVSVAILMAAMGGGSCGGGDNKVGADGAAAGGGAGGRGPGAAGAGGGVGGAPGTAGAGGTSDRDSGVPVTGGTGGTSDRDSGVPVTGGTGGTVADAGPPRPVDSGMPVPASLSCLQILQCIAACPDADMSCPDACVTKGTTDGQTKIVALVDCIEKQQCADSACVEAKCSVPLDACRGPRGGSGGAGGTGGAGGSAGGAGGSPSEEGWPVVETLHANALVRAFEENEVNANFRYIGKRVGIFGNVNSVSIEGERIRLSFKSGVFNYATAVCFFSQAHSARLAALRTNDEVTVNGTVRLYDRSVRVMLDNCSFP